MRVLTSAVPVETETRVTNHFVLPQGLIGFRDYSHAELLYLPDHLPFLWMKLTNPEGDSVHFVVIEPGGIIPDYEPELFENDAAVLEVHGARDTMVLNIVTIDQDRPLDAKVNLIGPIIVNRRTKIGRQLVIANYSNYSAHYALVSSTPVAASA
ncbi:MAG: flagellar assembly protein FliW [Candidatus Didemnitutus sp.]|nr:flagellar assembly protein FliW [Candidatus Didemnitutus sp.]